MKRAEGTISSALFAFSAIDRQEFSARAKVRALRRV
jgi:hypothetical protein